MNAPLKATPAPGTEAGCRVAIEMDALGMRERLRQRETDTSFHRHRAAPARLPNGDCTRASLDRDGSNSVTTPTRWEAWRSTPWKMCGPPETSCD